MKIGNVNVWGIEETAKASGLPMSITDEPKSSMKRLYKLGKCKVGSGHDCALKGIVVQTDITAPQYWWQQFQRYHFADIVSSQSKMHRIAEMDIDKLDNGYILKDIKNIITRLQIGYNRDPTKGNFNLLISNVPMGIELTARIVTNYLQLKTIYKQRKAHKLSEWKAICEWIKALPHFKEMVLDG